MASSNPTKPEYGCFVEDILKLELNEEELSFSERLSMRKDKKSNMKGDVFIPQIDGDYVKFDVEVSHATVMKPDGFGNTSVRYSCKNPVYSISKLRAIIHHLHENKYIDHKAVMKLSNDPSLSSFGIFYPGAKYIPYNTPNNKIDKNMKEYYNIQSIKFPDTYADTKFSIRDIAKKGPYKICLNIKNICIAISKNKITGDSFTELRFSWYFGCIILFKPERLSLQTTDLNGNPIKVGPVLEEDDNEEETDEDEEYKKERKERKEKSKKETLLDTNSTRRSKAPVIPEDVSLTNKYSNQYEEDEPIVVKKEVRSKKVIIPEDNSSKKVMNSKAVTKEVKHRNKKENKPSRSKKPIISEDEDDEEDEEDEEDDNSDTSSDDVQVKPLVTKKSKKVIISEEEDVKQLSSKRGVKQLSSKKESRQLSSKKEGRSKKLIISDDSD